MPLTCPGPVAPEEAEGGAVVFTLPSTVGVRRRRAESCTRRRSQQTQRRRSFSDAGGSVDTVAGGLTASPIRSSCSAQNPGATPPSGAPAGPTHSIGPDQVQHSTPEPAKPTRQPRKKHGQQQQRVKPEPAACKPERGRKGERGPLKKPWENTKPSRTRSKSRDRSTRPPATQGPPADNLNTSLGFNDTFDFDCEGAVHLTPFKAKAETAGHRDGEGENPLTTTHAGTPGESPPGEPPPVESPLFSSESEGELYVPPRGRRKRSSPEESRPLPGRRGRRVSSVVLHSQQEVSGEHFRITTIIVYFIYKAISFTQSQSAVQ